MRFQFDTNADEEKARVMKSLIRNSGRFNNSSQAREIKNSYGIGRTAGEMQKYFGITMESGQYPVFVEGWANGSTHGHRVMMPVTEVYILDTNGVVSSYRLDYVSKNAQFYPNPEKTETKWTRPVATAVQEVSNATVATETIPVSNGYVGEIGSTYTFNLRVTHVRPVQSVYGVSNLHTMEDRQGRIFKWFSSSQVLGVGQFYRIRGQVKEHSMFRGERQTVITRCRVQ